MLSNPARIAPRPLLLGHRGFRSRGLNRFVAADSPAENSLAAFEYALSEGCDGFEFDVRHTRDGRNVLWHDPEWNARVLAATDYSNLAGRDGNSLACLEDVLHLFYQRSYLDIELKVAGSEESILAALKNNPPQRGFMVSSFLPEVLVRLHGLDGDLPLGFICDRQETMSLWSDLPIKVFLPRHDLVHPKLIDKVQQGGRQIMAWTVNSPNRMQELAAWGIDGLISDDPTLLYQTFHIA